MAIRTAEAEWNGNLAQGSGQMRLGRGACEGPNDFRSRMGDGKGTINTRAKVHFEERDGEWSIHRIDLEAEARGVDLAAAAFEEYAEGAKNNCPVSRALSGIDIYLHTKLL